MIAEVACRAGLPAVSACSRWACCAAAAGATSPLGGPAAAGAGDVHAALWARSLSGSAASCSPQRPGAASESVRGRKGSRGRREAVQSRLPPNWGRYAVRLRERDAAAFERMRLLLGFYDLPENAHMPRPPPLESVTLSNLQTLRYLDDVDPYYRLALLSYRTKLLNREVAAGLAHVQAFLAAAGAEGLGEWVPPLTAAAATAPAAEGGKGGGEGGAASEP